MNDLFVGMWVDVEGEVRTGTRNSEGGRGIITDIINDNDQSTAVAVKYLLTNTSSPFVKSSRIRPADLILSGRRKARNGTTTPSLLSHLYGEYCMQQITQQSQEEVPSIRVVVFNSEAPEVVNTGLLLSMMLLGKNFIVDVVKKIKENNQTEGKGWLRKNEALFINNEQQHKAKTYLNEKEKELVLKLLLSLKPGYFRATSIIAFAWDVDASTVYRLMTVAKKSSSFTIARKKRCDIGQTIINNNKKCESIINTRQVFKKIKQQESRGEQLTRNDFYSSWRSLSDDRLFQLNRMAVEHRKRCQTILLDAGQILRRTRGAISWSKLTSQINGAGVPIISKTTLRRHIMKLPQSSYTTTQLLPKLNSSTKNKRLDWAKAFWIFWNQAKLLTNKVFVLLVHMDEKWFYSTVVRKNNKYVPFLGMEKPTYHRVNKKSHLHKEMFICSTGYLPNDNNIETGGLSFTLSCERVGHYTPAKKTTYRREYNDDGTYTYPQIEANILRRRGEMYFEGLEIRGASEGTVSIPKYSLLKIFLDLEIPRLDELTEELTSRFGTRTIVWYQLESAGPHVEKKLTTRLEEEFRNRGWMIVPQPPNSPICNVKNACIFPALSKAVSSIQATIYNNKMLEGDEINTCVQQAWTQLPKTTISRTYLHHHQIVAAIVRDNGGEDFMTEPGVSTVVFGPTRYPFMMKKIHLQLGFL